MNFSKKNRRLWIAPVFLVALSCVAAENPVAHVDIKTTKSYEGQQPLPKPDRVVVYDFAVNPEVVQTDPRPGVRGRITSVTSSKDPATRAADQVRDQITKDLVGNLQKRLKTSGISVEKGMPDTQISGNTMVIHGTITSLNQGQHVRREAVGFGAGASDVTTDCEITMQTGDNSVLVSELATDAKSGKKPGAAVTMGAGAAPDVAAGATGATAHKSTAQGDAGRTGSALAKHISDWMNTQGWISSAQPSDAAKEQN